jgi:cytosine/adenosine deaminase-related metal-dependent hydrolase/SAM-dependent methyltransferase
MKPEAMEATEPRRVDAREGYRLWAREYDRGANPFLTLEQRFLGALLPPVEDKVVLDVGCGTGRWLEHFAGHGPRRLAGVDLSAEMLEVAKEKVGAKAELFEWDCSALDGFTLEADVALGSFLLSYVEDLPGLAQSLRRGLRDGGSLFVTDIHPETKLRLGWRRGFRAGGESFEIATFHRTIEETLADFENCGFELQAFLQPAFGEPEKAVFTGAGKLSEFEKAAALPAIYVLQLTPRKMRGIEVANRSDETEITSIGGARVAFGANESAVANMSIASGRVARFIDGGGGIERSSADSTPAGEIDLSGFLLLPGLINTHDHLEFALFPRLGKGGYGNFLEWAREIHESAAAVIQEQRNVPRETRLRWGGIRNLLCGVTSVCHHNPYEAEVFESRFPVRVLKEYGWAHSVALDSEVAEKRHATAATHPFILHLGEGVDSQSGEELFRLESKYPVDEQTVLVHGLGLTSEGRELLRERNAKLIWCPSSNEFLFGRTLRGEDLRALPCVALGSDSPLTAKGDLLDEIRFARECCQVSAEELYAMVTTRAALALRMRGGEGTLRVDAPADFFAVADRGDSPAETLSQLSFRDVQLVVIGGQVRLAAPEILGRLDAALSSELEPVRIDECLRWVREEVRRLFDDAQRYLTAEIRLGGRRVDCDAVDSHI